MVPAMPTFPVAQALYRRDFQRPARLVGRSVDFDEAWTAEAERLIVGFGERQPGLACPSAVFAQPFLESRVAVVQVADLEPGPSGWPAMAYRFLVLSRTDYENSVADPFALAARHPFDRALLARSELPTLEEQAAPPPSRTIEQVRAILRRVKAHALQEGEDPETAVRTAENSESPALLGGVQILLDGGKLCFARKAPDNELAQAFWTLLPDPMRSKIWPASFAFGNALGFDLVFGSGFAAEEIEDSRDEDQAADYPPGAYELALQSAAENGGQEDLDAVFRKRSGGETLRLARNLLFGMILLVVAFRFLGPPPGLSRAERLRRAVAAAGIVGVKDPLQMAPMLLEGDRLFRAKEAP